MDANVFPLRSVVHLIRPAGHQASDLETLRAGIAGAAPESLFCHAVQRALRRPESSELSPDDFSSWVNGVVQDRETAERLSFAVQSRSGSATELKEGLLEVLDGVPEKDRRARVAPAEAAFSFLISESVLVPTGIEARHPDELVEALGIADASVWFYHLLEQPFHEATEPSIVRWARERGDPRLAEWLREEAHSGRGLEEMRRRLMRRWRRSRLHVRIAAAAEATEGERRAVARAAVAGLVRRMTRPEGSDEPRHGS